jgi:hypothetical protein
MPVLEDAKNQSAESANQPNFRVIGSKRSSARNALGTLSPAPFISPSQAHPYEEDLRSLDTEQWEAEDSLGCARGVVWSLIFEAALAVVAVLYWKFHFFSH